MSADRLNTSPGPYEAAVLADSIPPWDRGGGPARLTTLVVNMPRFVLAEFNTHRMLSRNSASSRAIPVSKRIEMIEADPFVPLSFGKNRKGMQSTEDLEGDDAEVAREAWLAACRDALRHARTLEAAGVHKQFANRVLEPFAFHTVIVTATEWENYFALRISEYAQPEIRRVSEAMKVAMDRSTPQKTWHHLPLVTPEEGQKAGHLVLMKLSSARCARVSYLTHDGKADVDADLALADRLLSAGHMSPFEHAAQAKIGCGSKFIGNFRAPWVQYRKELPNEDVFKG